MISLCEVSQPEVYVDFNNCLHMSTCLQSLYAKLSGISEVHTGNLNQEPLSCEEIWSARPCAAVSDTVFLEGWESAREKPVINRTCVSSLCSKCLSYIQQECRVKRECFPPFSFCST